MAGIFCLIAPADDPRATGVASRLAEGMRLFPRQHAVRLSLLDGRVYLGAVVNGDGHDRDGQYLLARGGRACAVEGHISRCRVECGAAAPLARGAYAEAVLAAYERFGPGFAAHLEGQYNALVADEAARVVCAANGRHAQSPLYVHSRAGWAVLATSLGPLGACGVFRPRLDEDAARVMLSFGQLFGRQTLLQDVSVLDGASVASLPIDAPVPESRPYWDYGQIGPKRGDVSLRQTVNELCALFEAAADRMVMRPGPLVSGLSGGNDSRLVTGLAARRRPDLKAWTFGTPGSPDLPVAAEVCQVLDIAHLTFGVDPADVPRWADRFVTAVDGSMTAAHAFFLPRAEALGEQARVVLNGYGGDYLLQGGLLDLGPRAAIAYARGRLGRRGPAPHPRLEGNRDREGVVSYLEVRYGRPSGLAPLLRPAAPDFRDLANRELAAWAARTPLEYLIEQWGFENRGRRWTVLGMVADRHFHGDDCVYYDDELFDRCLATPNGMRRGNRLHNIVVRELIPTIADIVSSNTGLPATAPAWRIAAHKAWRRAAPRVAPRGYSTGVNVEAWSRGAQRDFYTGLLADASTRSRPVWDGEALRRAADEHFAGSRRFGRELGLVAAVELFCRRWIDPCASIPAAAEGGSAR